MHEKQWQFLTKAAELGNLPHALLFYGRENLGKKDLAIKLGEQLVGLNNPADFIVTESPSISEIRELIAKLSFKPYSAEYKVAIVDKAHLMTREAQNCFLKFLEEPTEKTILILVTEYPATLLSTIISRVQKIRFYPEKGSVIEDPEEIVTSLKKLKDSDLAFRFKYVKKITDKESNDNIKEILDVWLRYFRKEMLANYTSNAKDIIKQIQSTQLLLSTTNANPKLALELLLMKL